MSLRRREFMQTLASGLVVVGGGALAARPAWASDLSLSERIDRLYSTRFLFDERGEPRISVGLMQGRSTVRITAPTGMRVLPSGDGGTAIVAGPRWSVELAKGTPAKQRWSVAVESLPVGNTNALERAAKRWRKRDVEVSEREVGGLFGISGKLLDTRRVLLVAGDFESEEAARTHARTLVSRDAALGLLQPTVDKRGHGRMVARDLDHDLRVEAEGVLWFASLGDEPIVVHDLVDEDGKAVGDRRFRGEIYVAIDRFGKLSVVNLAAERQVLAGLVPAEIFPSAPAAALEAQAIAARGQLVAKLGTRHLDDPFLICAHQHCQVYSGVEKEDPRTTKAVEATIGKVLMRPDGQSMVDTVFSANSGGHTEDNDKVWSSPVDPQLRGRIDPRAAKAYPNGIAEDLRAWLESAPSSYSRPESGASAASYRWRAELDPAALAGNPGVAEGIGTVSRLEVLARGCSGRATHLRVHAERGEIDVHGELAIRRALGGLKSSMFVVLPDRDRHGRLVLVGGGHGHGVGMCQHGAMGMARAGLSVTKILAHYYEGSTLAKLW